MSKETQNKIKYKQLDDELHNEYSNVIVLDKFIKSEKENAVVDFIFCEVCIDLGQKIKAYSNDESKFICKSDIRKIKNFTTGETIEFRR